MRRCKVLDRPLEDQYLEFSKMIKVPAEHRQRHQNRGHCPNGPWLGEDDDQERFVRSQVVGCMNKHTVCHLPYLGKSLSATVNAAWDGRFTFNRQRRIADNRLSLGESTRLFAGISHQKKGGS